MSKRDEVVDNSTFDLKVQLRQRALRELGQDPAVVLETHAGVGRIYSRCYSSLKQGVAIEKDGSRAETLALHRPGWSVYEADSDKVLALGAGAHLPVNFVDLDPYGQPWIALDGFLAGMAVHGESVPIARSSSAQRSRPSHPEDLGISSPNVARVGPASEGRVSSKLDRLGANPSGEALSTGSSPGAILGSETPSGLLSFHAGSEAPRPSASGHGVSAPRAGRSPALGGNLVHGTGQPSPIHGASSPSGPSHVAIGENGNVPAINPESTAAGLAPIVHRPRPSRLVIVANDGTRGAIRIRGAWGIESLRSVVERFGNNLHETYVDVCKVMVQDRARAIGYRLSRWTAYYAGVNGWLTHWCAVLDRTAG